jgi:hypothetical protein
MSASDAIMATLTSRGRRASEAGALVDGFMPRASRTPGTSPWVALASHRCARDQGMNDTRVSTTLVLVTRVATWGGGATDARKRCITGDVEGAPASGFVEVDAGAAGVAPA